MIPNSALKVGSTGRPAPRIASINDRRDDDISVLALLSEICDRLTRIEAKLAPRRAREPELLGHLLEAITGWCGSDEFFVVDLFDEHQLEKVFPNVSRKRVGRLLSTAVDQNVKGLTVEKILSEHNTAMWRVLRVVS
jgi:hypothetical protein